MELSTSCCCNSSSQIPAPACLALLVPAAVPVPVPTLLHNCFATVLNTLFLPCSSSSRSHLPVDFTILMFLVFCSLCDVFVFYLLILLKMSDEEFSPF